MALYFSYLLFIFLLFLSSLYLFIFLIFSLSFSFSYLLYLFRVLKRKIFFVVCFFFVSLVWGMRLAHRVLIKFNLVRLVSVTGQRSWQEPAKRLMTLLRSNAPSEKKGGFAPLPPKYATPFLKKENEIEKLNKRKKLKR